MLSGDGSRNNQNSKHSLTFKYKPLNTQVFKNIKPNKNTNLIKNKEVEVNGNAVQNSQIEDQSSLNISKSKVSIIKWERPSDTPYFGQKRANNHKVSSLSNIHQSQNEDWSYENAEKSDMNYDTFNNKKWSSYMNKNKEIDSEDERYNEESFYDSQSESDEEKMKQSNTTKAFTSFKSTLKCSVS